jgi:hypothetical protein
MTNVCRTCGSTESQTIADARTLGLLKGLQDRIYTCCQIVTWADEQWLAWVEAAEEDRKAVDAVTRPLEFAETEDELVPVRLRNPQGPRFGSSADFR